MNGVSVRKDGDLTEHVSTGDPAAYTDRLGVTCIHLDELGYGTRSAMVLAVPETGAAQMFWAEGPPCTTPFVEFGTDVSKTAKTG